MIRTICLSLMALELYRSCPCTHTGDGTALRLNQTEAVSLDCSHEVLKEEQHTASSRVVRMLGVGNLAPRADLEGRVGIGMEGGERTDGAHKHTHGMAVVGQAVDDRLQALQQYQRQKDRMIRMQSGCMPCDLAYK